MLENLVGDVVAHGGKSVKTFIDLFYRIETLLIT